MKRYQIIHEGTGGELNCLWADTEHWIAEAIESLGRTSVFHAGDTIRIVDTAEAAEAAKATPTKKLFKVNVQQYVEKTATIEVEAENAERAKELALNNADLATWSDGDDAGKVEAYSIHDHMGDLVWER